MKFKNYMVGLGIGLSIAGPLVSTGSGKSLEDRAKTEDSRKFDIVKKGETLWSLHKEHSVSVGDLKKYNDIGEDNVIKIGQKIYLSEVNAVEKKVVKESEKTLLGKFVYGESANQKEPVREAIAKAISNRVGMKGYKDTLEKVILSDSRFTCVGSKKNKNWKQATGELKLNGYEEMIFKRCLDDAADVLDGKDLGYPNQDKWVAYHDKSVTYAKVCKLDKKYWSTLKADVKIGDIILYVPK